MQQYDRRFISSRDWLGANSGDGRGSSIFVKALYRDARILILDEPTAVLTPQEARMLFGTLRQMVGDARTVIFISHKLNEVTAVSDRVTVLRGGKSGRRRSRRSMPRRDRSRR